MDAYEKLESSDSSDVDGWSPQDAEHPLINHWNDRKARRRIWFWVATHLATTIFTGLLTFFVTWISLSPPLGRFDTGYVSDFAPARTSLQLETKVFSGTPVFAADGQMSIPHESPSFAYMGAGEAVDQAWDELIEDRYFLLTDDEAKASWGEKYTEYWDELRGGYTAGLDVLHTLHCLNYVRMALYPETYKFDKIHGAVHQEHCYNHIRQVIMCNADLTPIPSVWHSPINQNYIDADQMHTCRNFEAIRTWATERYNGSTSVKPRHRDGSPRKEFYSPEIIALQDNAASHGHQGHGG